MLSRNIKYENVDFISTMTPSTYSLFYLKLSVSYEGSSSSRRFAVNPFWKIPSTILNKISPRSTSRRLCISTIFTGEPCINVTWLPLPRITCEALNFQTKHIKLSEITSFNILKQKLWTRGGLS